jgi:hypothetical protein
MLKLCVCAQVGLLLALVELGLGRHVTNLTLEDKNNVSRFLKVGHC